MTTNNVSEFGSVEYYTKWFEDILCDIGTGDKRADVKTLTNILTAFNAAIGELLDYHENSAEVYREAQRQFLTTLD